MLEVDKVLQLKEKFVLYELELGKGGMFWLFNIENGDSVRLNETSYYILSLFDGYKSIGEIRNYVLDKYQSIDSDTISEDFEELLNKMNEEGIFEERRVSDERR